MSNKNVYEILEDFSKAKNRSERLNVLKRNDCFALRNVLIGTFHKDAQYYTKKIPEYNIVDVPPGLSYNNMTQAIDRVYLFLKNNPRTPPALTEERKNQLLIQLLESLEPKEAQVFVNMMHKDLKVSYLTEALVNEAFPGLLPQ